MSWWTALFAVRIAVHSSTAEQVSKQHRPSLCCEQGGQLWVKGRPAIRCRVMGLFVQLRAEWVKFWPVDRDSLREGWLQNLWLGLKSHSVLDKGLSVCPSVVWSLAVTVCPLRPCREIGLCNRMFATRGMKSLRVDGPWCVGVPGSSRAKSESKQRSLFRDRILLGRSSRDISESLRRRLYLVRFSMPVEEENVLIIHASTVILLVLIMSVMTTKVEHYLVKVLSVIWTLVRFPLS